MNASGAFDFYEKNEYTLRYYGMLETCDRSRLVPKFNLYGESFNAIQMGNNAIYRQLTNRGEVEFTIGDDHFCLEEILFNKAFFYAALHCPKPYYLPSNSTESISYSVNVDSRSHSSCVYTIQSRFKPSVSNR